MKKIKYFLFMFFLFFSYVSSSKAYVRVNASFGTFEPVQNSNVNSSTISSIWTNGTYPVLENEPWLLSFDQFFYLGSANGTYLNVNADYYVAFNTPAAYTSYLNSARNTLTVSNLRCGIGGYRTGYDSSYIPEISNFEVTEVSSSPAGGFGTNYLYHIKFNYSQQIRKVLLNNQNASCWFEIPTNYLVGQLKGSNLTYNVAFWSNTVNLQSAVSDNPLAGYLADITNQTNTIINQSQTIISQNNQTNQNLDKINGSLTDETPPDTSGLSSAVGWLPPGPVDSILNLPLSFFNSLNESLSSSCKPVMLPLPYVDKNIELPCLNSVYSKINGLSVWINGIGIVASAFILYTYLLKLYKWVDDQLSLRENTWNDMDQWGGI